MPFNEAKGGARLPALDGLRAVSICLVLLGHLSATRGFPNLTFERWFGDLSYAEFPQVIRESFAELKAVTAGG